MKVQVLLSPHNVDELYFTDKTTVVIDVLRATTVIIKALEAGAREIVPVGSVDFAMKVSGNAHGGSTLLCGERNTKMIEGFDLGNSPLEYTEESVGGKSIIFFTTNGSKAIVKAKFSENLFICGFTNLSSVANHLITLKKDAQILCAGSNGMFSIEDTVCAGELVKRIIKARKKTELSDSAKASLILSEQFGSNIEDMLANSEHGKLLIENGFEEDIKFCAKISKSRIIPYLTNSTLKVLKKETEKK